MNSDKKIIKKNVVEKTDCSRQKSKCKRKAVSLREIVLSAPAQLIEKYVEGYDLLTLAKVFGDAETLRTAHAFFDSNLNISKTAKALYMHRNTLIYRLNKIKKLTGLDIKKFDDAVSFEILAIAYVLKWRSNEEKK